ncbi:MAG: hypothetical protein K2J73_00780 [Oscillospiraceae bacterium]|nr:hypothetical protein [Oscillospiraceae bacterium]
MNDKEIVRRLKSWDVRGLESLIDKNDTYVGMIIRRIILSTLSESDAEELVVNAFTMIWCNPKMLTEKNLLQV